jgi:glycosyltransferase involved in cell wall biosynthesis
MEEFATHGKAVGIVLDLSHRLGPDGQRIVDSVRDALLAVVPRWLDDALDVMYLYHPDIIESVAMHGDQVCAIDNYETDGWEFNVQTALKQTLYVLGGEDVDFDKYVILVTDRLQSERSLVKLISLSKKDMIDARVIVIGVGEKYKKSALDAIAKSDADVTVLHLGAASELPERFFKEIKNGQQNPSCPSDERGQYVQLSGGHRDTLPRSV